MNREKVMLRRDEKAKRHLEQYAPVWKVAETFVEADDAVFFNVVFHHPEYGWVNRRYKYDGFNDVLYHKGQVTIDEETAIQVQEMPPYLSVSVADVPNAYGG
jgi:hypothetical protein